MIEDSALKAIATVGFPIVMCLLMFYMMNGTIKKNTEAILALTVHIRSQRRK